MSATTQLTGDTLLHQHALNISPLQTSNQHLSRLQVQSLALQQRTTKKFHHCCLHQAPQKPTPPGKQAGKFGRVGPFSQAWPGAPHGMAENLSSVTRNPWSEWAQYGTVKLKAHPRRYCHLSTLDQLIVLPWVAEWKAAPPPTAPPPPHHHHTHTVPHNHQDKDHNNNKTILHKSLH